MLGNELSVPINADAGSDYLITVEMVYNGMAYSGYST